MSAFRRSRVSRPGSRALRLEVLSRRFRPHRLGRPQSCSEPVLVLVDSEVLADPKLLAVVRRSALELSRARGR